MLILGPWPTGKLLNGGQMRCAAIADAYRQDKHIVQVTGFYDPTNTPAGNIAADDIKLMPGVGDIMSQGAAQSRWEAVAMAPDSIAAFRQKIKDFLPDVLQFEEPALWPVVRRLLQEGELDGVAVIHSSYNFETLAWQDLRTAGAEVDDAAIAYVASIEKEIAQECDLIAAVSEEDVQAFSRLGAASVVLAANGTEGVTGSPAVNVLRCYLANQAPYALFVSSAHPPNAYGMVALAAQCTSRPVRHGEIVVCGGVGGLMRQSPRFRQASAVLEGARYLGWVDTDLRNALYSEASVIVLPKVLGGGSNLKTAEALISGRPIVATALAFRGFEDCADWPGVHIEDDADQFWAVADDFLSGVRRAPIRSGDALNRLRWTECLKPLVAATERVVASGNLRSTHRRARVQTPGYAAPRQ